jgi:predicted Zn-dependent protease
VQHPDADLLQMPDPVEASGSADGDARTTQAIPARHFEGTAGITPEQRAEGVKKIVGVAEKHKLTTAGVFSSAESLEGIFNSRGLSNWHTQTLAEVSITMLAGDSSGWQKSNSPDVGNLDPLGLAETAAQKALDSARPREIPAGIHVLGLFGHGDPGPALVLGGTNWHEVIRRQHHDLG